MRVIYYLAVLSVILFNFVACATLRNSQIDQTPESFEVCDIQARGESWHGKDVIVEGRLILSHSFFLQAIDERCDETILLSMDARMRKLFIDSLREQDPKLFSEAGFKSNMSVAIKVSGRLLKVNEAGEDECRIRTDERGTRLNNCIVVSKAPLLLRKFSDRID